MHKMASVRLVLLYIIVVDEYYDNALLHKHRVSVKAGQDGAN